MASGTFPDQGSNPCALHWQADAHALHHQGSPCLLVLGHMRQAPHHQDPCFEQEASSLCHSRCGPSVPPLWTGGGRGVEAMGLRCTTGVSASHTPLERSGSPSGQSGEYSHWRSGAASGRDTAAGYSQETRGPVAIGLGGRRQMVLGSRRRGPGGRISHKE